MATRRTNPPDDSTPGGRLEIAMQRAGVNDAELAKRVKPLLAHFGQKLRGEGIKPQTVQASRTTHRTVIGRYVVFYAHVLGVDPFWLAFREGKMTAEARSEPGAWPFRWPRDRWDRLSREDQMYLDGWLGGRVMALAEDSSKTALRKA